MSALFFRPIVLLSPMLAIGCAMPEPEPINDLVFLGGYRDPADQCEGVGESPSTSEFLSDAADLVACPVDYEGTGVFVTDTGATEVGAVSGYQLFSVPVR